MTQIPTTLSDFPGHFCCYMWQLCHTVTLQLQSSLLVI